MSHQGIRTVSSDRPTSPRYGRTGPRSPSYYGHQGATYGGYYGPYSPYRGGYYGTQSYGTPVYTAPILTSAYGNPYGYPYTDPYGYINPVTTPLLAATAATAGLIGLATAPRYY